MKIERTKNAVRNTKWGLLQKLVNVLLPFLVRTVLIYTLSAQYAGLSSLFTSVLSILSLTELGFSQAIVYSMYKPVAEDDRDKICALLHVYRRAYRIIGSVILGVGLIILPLLPRLIHGDVPADANIYLLYTVYLINNVISYFLYGYKTSLLSAHQREDVISRNTLLYNIILYGVQCAVLLLFRNYYIYTLVIPLATVLLNLLNNRAVTRMFPDYKPAGTIDEEEKAILKKNLVGLMIGKIGGATRNTLDSIIVSMYLGLVAVAMYNNYFFVVNGVTVFLTVINPAITAGVGNKMATESPERNYKDFVKFHFYYMWLAGWCCVCMMCLFQPFMRLWMGESMMFSEGIMLLFCYYFLMMKQGDINAVYYQAAGLWWHGRYKSLAEAAINLVLNLLLGKLYGVPGIILATIISFTCVYFYGSQFVFSHYFKNGKLTSFYLDNLYYMAVTALVGFGTYFLLERLTGARWDVRAVLAVRLAVCAVLPNALFFAIYGMRKRNRAYVKQAFRMLRRRAADKV